jgi:hypothetical protein
LQILPVKQIPFSFGAGELVNGRFRQNHLALNPVNQLRQPDDDREQG